MIRAALLCGLLFAGLNSFAAKIPLSNRGFVVIAHRGDHTAAHENTLAAIANAIAVGADYAEIDLRATRDGEIVLMHDATVDRTTNGRGKVEDLSLEDIRKLEVEDPSRPQIPKAKVPTFAEALAAAAGKIHLYLDVKQASPEQVAKLVRAAGMERQVIIYDGLEDIPAWRSAAPGFPMICSPSKSDLNPDAIKALVQRTSLEILDGNALLYSKETVAAAKAAGAAVWPDIQGPWESPELWERIVALGFTGVQTDNPGKLIEWLKSKSLRWER